MILFGKDCSSTCTLSHVQDSGLETRGPAPVLLPACGVPLNSFSLGLSFHTTRCFNPFGGHDSVIDGKLYFFF